MLIPPSGESDDLELPYNRDMNDIITELSHGQRSASDTITAAQTRKSNDQEDVKRQPDQDRYKRASKNIMMRRERDKAVAQRKIRQ
jgi:hypothetical protein